jgi:hypothetical protein
MPRRLWSCRIQYSCEQHRNACRKLQTAAGRTRLFCRVLLTAMAAKQNLQTASCSLTVPEPMVGACSAAGQGLPQLRHCSMTAMSPPLCHFNASREGRDHSGQERVSPHTLISNFRPFQGKLANIRRDGQHACRRIAVHSSDARPHAGSEGPWPALQCEACPADASRSGSFMQTSRAPPSSSPSRSISPPRGAVPMRPAQQPAPQAVYRGVPYRGRRGSPAGHRRSDRSRLLQVRRCSAVRWI